MRIEAFSGSAANNAPANRRTAVEHRGNFTGNPASDPPESHQRLRANRPKVEERVGLRYCGLRTKTIGDSVETAPLAVTRHERDCSVPLLPALGRATARFW